MKIGAFTFVRNALKYDYPVVEAIKSVLPLCDELIVAVGISDDKTEELIHSIEDPRIKIINTFWDDSLRIGGKVLAIETDKAFDALSESCDWAVYIQADEVLHESSLNELKNAMHLHLNNAQVQGLLVNYRHFYGSYDYVADSTRWYRREVRVIRNDKRIRSFRDAQGFRFEGKTKLHVKLTSALIHHYGWVKQPKAMQSKQENFHKLWHEDQWIDANIVKAEEFDYSGIDSLELFNGTHPLVMHDRISSRNWKFDFDISRKKLTNKERFRRLIQKLTGWRIGEYRNYKII